MMNNVKQVVGNDFKFNSDLLVSNHALVSSNFPKHGKLELTAPDFQPGDWETANPIPCGDNERNSIISKWPDNFVIRQCLFFYSLH